jgi:hypothetical protein
VLKRFDVTKATVRGKHQEGFDDVLHLTENPDPFGVWELEKGPTKTTVIADNVPGSLLIRKLVEAAEKHPKQFGDRS